jgi:hypothetical protein
MERPCGKGGAGEGDVDAGERPLFLVCNEGRLAGLQRGGQRGAAFVEDLAHARLFLLGKLPHPVREGRQFSAAPQKADPHRLELCLVRAGAYFVNGV